MHLFSPARLSRARGGPVFTPSALAIDQPDGSTPPVAFRALLYLRFATDGADGITIDEAATTLKGQFLPVDRNARIAGADPAATLAPTGNGVRIVLATPRRLQKVRLKPSISPALGAKLRVHRVDGEAVSDQATTTATNRGLPSLFRDRAIAPSSDLAASARSTERALGLGSELTDGLRIDSDRRVFALSGAQPFDADRFVVFLDDPLGQPIGLAPGDLDEVGIRTFPTGPRIGLVLLPAEAPAPDASAGGDPLEQPNFFFRANGLVGGGDVPLAAGMFNAGTDLAKALAAALALLEAPLPAAIDIALVFASDAPCQLDLDAFTVGYRLIRSSWPAPTLPDDPLVTAATPDRNQRSARFGPGSEAEATGGPLRIELPAGARIETARIQGSLRLGPHRPPATGLPALALASTVGVEIVERTAALQRIDPTVSPVTAVALPLLPLARGTTVRLEILEDAEGELGRIVATSELELERAGAQRWAILPLSRPANLASRPLWLRLAATRGALLWLTRPASGIIRRTESPSPQSLPPELPPISGYQAMYELLSSTTPPENKTAPVDLRLGEIQIPNTAATEDEVLFDCKAAIEALLAQNNGATFQADFDFASDFSGQLLLTPPHIEYTLG